MASLPGCTAPLDNIYIFYCLLPADITVSSEDVIAEAQVQSSYMQMAPSSEQSTSTPGGAGVTTPTSSSSAAGAEYMDMSPSAPQGNLNGLFGE